MLGTTVPYQSVGKQSHSEFVTHLYSFKCTLNVYYIVEVEKFNNDILIVKFFQKNHRDSDDKYSLTNTSKFLKLHNSNGTRNFLIILHTVTKIIIENHLNNDNYSFGFLGSPTKWEQTPENSINHNADGTIAMTQRYRIYGAYLKRYFSPTTFEHIEFPTSSAYLIKRIKNTSLTTNEIEIFFEEYIREYC